MGRFDWASDGTFDFTDLPEDEFKAKFNGLSDEDKLAILDDLQEATDDAEAKAKAVKMVARIGSLVLKAGSILA